MIRTKLARSLLAPALLALAACSAKPTVVARAPSPPADADADGVPDNVDQCVGEKEDGLLPDPKDGCKTTDADGDGVPDASDKCPDQKEDGQGPATADGCPNLDPDGDGIAGNDDKCPSEPETKNDFEDNDGCPDKLPRVQVTRTEVKINEKILFAFDKAVIDVKSNGLLDNIAEVMLKNPQIEFLEIAGHADHVGTDTYNVSLTRQRAQAVYAALTKRGVDPRSMRPIGYGDYCPRDKGESDEAREKNRRVEFKILRVDGVETGVELGCEQALAKGIKPVELPKTAPTRAQNEAAQATALAKLAAYRASRPPSEEAKADEPSAASKGAKSPGNDAKGTKPARGKEAASGKAGDGKAGQGKETGNGKAGQGKAGDGKGKPEGPAGKAGGKDAKPATKK